MLEQDLILNLKEPCFRFFLKDTMMKYSLILALLLGMASSINAEETTEVSTVTPQTPVVVTCQNAQCPEPASVVQEEQNNEPLTTHITVVGQGVAPMNTSSPAQAMALAKRAAVADAYRLIAEKIKGVRIDGQDLIKNGMVQKSMVRISVDAMIRNANIVETKYKDGLCEVEMEIIILHSR